MNKEEKIATVAKKLTGFSGFLIKGELKQLAKILAGDEEVEDMVQGVYHKRQGLLVATNKRLIFIYKGMLWGMTLQDFSYEKINTVEYNIGLVDGRLTVYASGNAEEIKNVMPKSQVREFGEFVRSKLNAKVASPPVMVPSTSVAEQLEKLVGLKEKGFLNDEEFAIQKAKILNS